LAFYGGLIRVLKSNPGPIQARIYAHGYMGKGNIVRLGRHVKRNREKPAIVGGDRAYNLILKMNPKGGLQSSKPH
jgi:hypothetical protein